MIFTSSLRCQYRDDAGPFEGGVPDDAAAPAESGAARHFEGLKICAATSLDAT
jgi:hypothetical protein